MEMKFFALGGVGFSLYLLMWRGDLAINHQTTPS